VAVKNKSGRWRAAVIVVSVAAHAGLLAGLVASVRPLVLGEDPPLVVELVRPERPTETPEPPAEAQAGPERRLQPAPRASPERPSAPRPVPQPVPPLPVAPAPAPPPAAAPTTAPAPIAPARPAARSQGDVGEGVRRALRTTVGCAEEDVIGLTQRERDECRRRLGEARRGGPPAPNERQRAMRPGPARRDAHAELRPEWDCGAGGSLGCRGSAVMVGASIPFGYVPPALPVIPPSTLRGDDDALRPKPPK
jgi:hypothetical protein